MNFLSENAAILGLFISVLVLFVGMVLSWQKMRDAIDKLTERATENRNAIEKSYIDLKEMLVKDLLLFRQDHDRTRQIISEHVMDTGIHQSPEEKSFRAEWREAVMKRLERIEAMISEIHKGIKIMNKT